MTTTLIAPAEIFDALESLMCRAGFGYRLESGTIDLTDVALERGPHSGLATPKPKPAINSKLRG